MFIFYKVSFDSITFCAFHESNKYAMTTDDELEQSEPKSRAQNQNGKQLKLQKVKIREHIIDQVSSSFPNSGHSATQTKLKT